MSHVVLPHMTLTGQRMSGEAAAALILGHAAGAAPQIWLVLEVPPRGKPSVSTYFGQEDFLERHHRVGADGVIFEAFTPRELAAFEGAAPGTIHDAAARQDTDGDPYFAGIIGLAEAYGWDRTLYRADWLAGVGQYRPAPINETEAVSAWAAHGLAGWYLIRSPAECCQLLALLEGADAPRIGRHGPSAAACALRREAQRHGWLASDFDMAAD